MLTGDNQHTAAAVAREVGISEFKAGMTPDDKHAEIERRQQAGEVVGMVGDSAFMSAQHWHVPTLALPSARAPTSRWRAPGLP